MAERMPAQHDDLERALNALGSELDYPRADLASVVRARLVAAPTAQPARWTALVTPRRALLFAPLAAAVALVLVLAASPSSRSAVADRIGLPGISISSEPTATVALPPQGTLQLGSLTTLDQAVSKAGHQVVPPPTALLGDPDAVYLLERNEQPQVTYVYSASADLGDVAGSGIGLLISQFPGTTNASFIEKQLADDTILELVLVNGERAFWLSGSPHVFFYSDPDGAIWEESIRLAGEVLIWQHDGNTLRIEATLSRDEVIRIAEAMINAR